MNREQRPPFLPLWRRVSLAGLFLGLFLAFGAVAGRAEDPPSAGLEYFDVPATGSYFWRYVPPNLPKDQPAPVVVFLHGSGGKPENYLKFIVGPALEAGCILVMPRSRNGLGWGDPADETTIVESLKMVRSAVPVDERRISVAGHSAGGAYAYLLAYETRLRFSAVFTMGARFYQVNAVSDPDYKAPIRMYYGSEDPNYFTGSAASLKLQWQRLGVAWEEEVRPGATHLQMYEASTLAGFRFLVSKSYTGSEAACVPSPNRLCLGPGGRFRVEMTWRDFSGQTGVGSVSTCGTTDTGLFWFFDPTNWELMVKVLDGCAINGHRWVFVAGTTTVEYALTVTDTLTGESVVYRNALGQPAAAVNDTTSLSGCP